MSAEEALTQELLIVCREIGKTEDLNSLCILLRWANGLTARINRIIQIEPPRAA